MGCRGVSSLAKFSVGSPSLVGATLPQPLPISLPLPLTRARPLDADSSFGSLIGVKDLTLLYHTVTIYAHEFE